MNDLFRLLPKLLKEFEDNESVREAVVFAAWRKIAGPSLCEHAVAFSIDQKRLVVAVTSERWTKYLRDLSGQMIFKINSALGQPAVTFIDFVVDEDFVVRDRQKHSVRMVNELELLESARRNLTPALRDKADLIKDEGLREQFLLAAGNCLARIERMKKK